MDTYEKKYEKALERAKKELDACGSQDCDAARQIFRLFPELAESEDEKIRKWLLDFVQGLPDEGLDFNFYNLSKKQVVAWLEKQGEKLPVGFYYVNSEGKKFYSDTFKYGDVILHVEKQGEPKPYGQREECLDCQVNYAGECKGSCELKRNEQKPIINGILTATNYDKMFQSCNKPKFKVGDWVVDNNGVIKQILSYKNCIYKHTYGYSGKIFEDEWRLWTIQDAKDGDVLAISWWEDYDFWEKIIIFKKYHNKGVKGLYSMPCVEGYGITFKNGELAINDEVPYYSKTWTCNLHPATKEEGGILFQKMKEAGYEWDAEKKEPKKIVQKPTEWSEEDIIRLQRIIDFLWYNRKGDTDTIYQQEQDIDWLKSIKDRVQPKQEWSEEDEDILNFVIARLHSHPNIKFEEYSKEYNWLKSIKQRIEG